MAPTVHLLAGLNGAGKSTYARQLAAEQPAVRFTLDEWMLRLFALHYDDARYPDLARRCTALIWDTAQQVLAVGVDVVLDWNQWSRERRAFWRDQVVSAGQRAVLHYLPVSIDTAIARAQERRQRGPADAHVLDSEGIRHLAALFEVPAEDEGLELQIVR
jgi:predicted kinase